MLNIFDKRVIEVALTQEGVNLIVDRIRSYPISGEITTEWHHEAERGSTSFETSISIHLLLGDGNYSSIVGISKNQIYINPIHDDIGNSLMKDLKSFIESGMISIIRNRKLDQIL